MIWNALSSIFLTVLSLIAIGKIKRWFVKKIKPEIDASALCHEWLNDPYYWRYRENDTSKFSVNIILRSTNDGKLKYDCEHILEDEERYYFYDYFVSKRIKDFKKDDKFQKDKAYKKMIESFSNMTVYQIEDISTN